MDHSDQGPISDRICWGTLVQHSQAHQETFVSAGLFGGIAADDQYGMRARRRSAALLAACGRDDLARLKTRALEVLLCVRAGDSNAEIADRLQISVSTVKYHLSGLVQSRQYLFN